MSQLRLEPIFSARDPEKIPTDLSRTQDSRLTHDEYDTNLIVSERSPRPIHGWKWVVAYLSILSTTFLFALDNTIVAAIQPSILNSFGQVNLLPWIGTGYALGSTAVLPWGRAYGIFDVKRLFISHVILFEIGSALCGAAPNMTPMIIGRVIAGLGGAGMYSGSLTYISVLTSLRERPMYVAGIAVTWGAGSVLGPLVGGGFAISSATWRWAFYINLVVGAVFAPSYIFLLPSFCARSGTKFWDKCRMVDWIATVVFLGGAVCFTMAITFGGTTYPFNSAATVVLWTMTGILLVAFIAVTLRHPCVARDNRLFPAHFFKRPVMLNLGIQMFLVSGVMLAAVYYIPLYFSFTQGDGPMEASVRVLPFVCLMVFTSILSGALMPKSGYYYPWYLFGSCIMSIGSGLMVTVNENTTPAKVYGYTILVGAGAGCYLAAGFAVMQALVPASDISNAVGFAAITQGLGAVTFLSVSGSLFFNTASELITPILAPNTDPSFVADLVAGASSDAFRSLTLELRQEVIPRIAESMQNVWIWYLGGGLLSFVLACILGRGKLDL